jgi:hypothetical protein
LLHVAINVPERPKGPPKAKKLRSREDEGFGDIKIKLSNEGWKVKAIVMSTEPFP